jgi:Flp pilus assembly pilin Flp
MAFEESDPSLNQIARHAKAIEEITSKARRGTRLVKLKKKDQVAFWLERIGLASVEFGLALALGSLILIYEGSGWAFDQLAKLHKKIEGDLDE